MEWRRLFDGYFSYIKAAGLAYIISWIMLIILVDWYHVWVGYASIIITALVFNVKYFLLRWLWKPNEVRQ